MTNSLRKAVIEGRLKGPTQKGFSVIEWDKCLSTLTSPKDDDHRLHKAALFLGAQLEGLRRRLAASPPPSGSRIDRLRRSIGFVNREYLTVLGLLKPDISQGWFSANKLIQTEIPLAGGANAATGDQIIESIVDGLRFEIAETDRTSQWSESGQGLEALQRTILRGNLSVFYHILEEQWIDSLHHDWKIISLRPDRTLIQPANLASSIDIAVGMYRESTLNSEMVGRVVQLLKITGDAQRTAQVTRGIVTRPGRGRRREYVVENLSPDIAHEVLVAKFLAAEPDLELFSQQPLEALSGLTPAEMLDVWTCLVPLAHDIESRMPYDQNDQTIVNLGQLEQFAPLQDAQSLLSSIELATGLSSAKCASALENLTWRNVRDSLWHRPFVWVEKPRKLAVVLPALRVPNLRRSIEHWLGIGGFDLSERGDLYENHVREEISRSIRSNISLTRAGALPQSVNPPDQSIGDFDLVMWVGNTVLIAEVKCLLRPATGHEWFKYNQRILEAVDQVQRKVDYAKNNPEWLISLLPKSATNSGQLNIYPCVILNSPLGSLRVIRNVPVVDLYVIKRYFDPGHGTMYAFLGEETSGTIVPFYLNEDEAEANLSSYLSNPPHLSIYRESVQWRLKFQPDFVTENGIVVLKHPIVDVPIPEGVASHDPTDETP